MFKGCVYINWNTDISSTAAQDITGDSQVNVLYLFHHFCPDILVYIKLIEVYLQQLDFTLEGGDATESCVSSLSSTQFLEDPGKAMKAIVHLLNCKMSGKVPVL